MTEADLITILGDLREEEFEDFKWHLKKEKMGDIPPIQVSKLSGAKRRDTVDLMVEKYDFAGTVEVTRNIFKKMSRNDLVAKLAKISSGAEGPGVPTEDRVPAQDGVPAQERLLSVRTQFISGASDPVLNQLQDRLLERRIINDEEMQSATTKVKAEKARYLIDTVRNKGHEASSILIAALREVDPCLSRKLNFN